MSSDFPTIDEKDERHQTMMEIEPLLVASGYRTWRNILLNQEEYPCHCLTQTFYNLYPKRANLILLVVSANIAVRWLEVNADTSEQEMAVPTLEQLSRVSISKGLDLFKTTSKVLRNPKEIERIWARQRLMPWFRALMTDWVYERAKRDIFRNTEAYRSFQLDIGPGAYKRAFLTRRNAVTIAVKRAAGMSCTTERERKEVLQAVLERNVSLCLQNSFCRNREQKVNVDLLLCCKQRLLEQESWDRARNSVDMLQKELEDGEKREQEQEAME